MTSPTIQKYIDKQALRSAIEKFTDKHENNLLAPNQKVYSELIPTDTPGKGQQYAFEVDLDKCTGCKACVTACHNENGLDEDETWRSVGLIQGGTDGNAALQHVTSACHHCVEPACMNGCPTKAYKKDEETGIVKHLDDQCFGCQYCILKCPYDVPKYNKRKGIVHKCDMCIGRLDKNQAPACVGACPNGAIRITIVDQQKVKENFQEFVAVADAPASDYTYPTTRYTSEKKYPVNMSSVDYYSVEPEHAHLPLVFMLTLTQLSVGAFLSLFYLMYFTDVSLGNSLKSFLLGFSLFMGLFALAASVMHLGRPQYAFRAILGIKTSWLSREILSFGVFVKAAILYATAASFSPIGAFFVNIFGEGFFPVVASVVSLFGVLGIYCSVMVYKDTRRPFWEQENTAFKFFLTSSILGMSTLLTVSLAFSYFNSDISSLYILDLFGRYLMNGIFGAIFIKLLVESSIFFHLTNNHVSFIKKTALLMTKQLRNYTRSRFICGLLGGFLFPSIVLQLTRTNGSEGSIIFFSLLSFGTLLAGELLERYLFFTAVVPLKMPGNKVV